LVFLVPSCTLLGVTPGVAVLFIKGPWHSRHNEAVNLACTQKAPRA